MGVNLQLKTVHKNNCKSAYNKYIWSEEIQSLFKNLVFLDLTTNCKFLSIFLQITLQLHAWQTVYAGTFILQLQMHKETLEIFLIITELRSMKGCDSLLVRALGAKPENKLFKS